MTERTDSCWACPDDPYHEGPGWEFLQQRVKQLQNLTYGVMAQRDARPLVCPHDGMRWDAHLRNGQPDE